MVANETKRVSSIYDSDAKAKIPAKYQCIKNIDTHRESLSLTKLYLSYVLKSKAFYY